MGDSADNTNINNVIRQIQTLQRLAGIKQEEAYRSQDGKGNVNEGLLRQGQAYLKQAEELIEQNIVPILQSLNPAQVASALAAAGASSELAAKVSTVLKAARTVAVPGMSTAAICEIISVAVPVLLVVVGAALLAVLFNMWLDGKNRKEGERVLQVYKDRLDSRSRHVPFQPRMIPGTL